MFESDLLGPRGKLKKGVMKGANAVISGTRGKGRVVLISPHFEGGTTGGGRVARGEPAAQRLLRATVFWAGKAAALPRADIEQTRADPMTQREIRQTWLNTRTAVTGARQTARDDARALGALLIAQRKAGRSDGGGRRPAGALL